MINAAGRRKSSVARVYLTPGKGKITINKRDLAEYFPMLMQQNAVTKPLTVTGNEGKFDVVINVHGGGLTGQADAIKMGLSRALVVQNEEHRVMLRPERMLTRDPRGVERKKPGQKKARKRFQFSKR